MECIWQSRATGIIGRDEVGNRKGHVCVKSSRKYISPVYMVHQGTIHGDRPISLHKIAINLYNSIQGCEKSS